MRHKPPAAICLLAVSKTWLAASLCEAIAAGQRVFGENYVQLNVSGEVSESGCAPEETPAQCKAVGVLPNLALETLSMGMSHNLEAAIAEGATLVRIGTAIFGERNYA